MSDNLKFIQNPNIPYITQNVMMEQPGMNRYGIQQMPSLRPNTLPIGNQFMNKAFTPNDSKVALSTPELLNALETPVINEGPSLQGVHILDELPPTRINNSNRPKLPMMDSFDQTTYKIVSHTEYQQQNNIPQSRTHQTTSPTSFYNPPGISVLIDNESSNLTSSSASPLSTIQHSERSKDELQHVPSGHGKSFEHQGDVVKKEKKRERNRQAAQKCRTRKLTRIAELQKRVNELQGKNKDLSTMAETLKSDISNLEQKLFDHHTQGCLLMNGSIV